LGTLNNFGGVAKFEKFRNNRLRPAWPNKYGGWSQSSSNIILEFFSGEYFLNDNWIIRPKDANPSVNLYRDSRLSGIHLINSNKNVNAGTALAGQIVHQLLFRIPIRGIRRRGNAGSQFPINPRGVIRAHFRSISYSITVTLFRKEQLAVVGKVLLAGVAADQSVKVSQITPRLWSKDPSQSLRFLLAG
jgi:hypothetical protein